MTRPGCDYFKLRLIKSNQLIQPQPLRGEAVDDAAADGEGGDAAAYGAGSDAAGGATASADGAEGDGDAADSAAEAAEGDGAEADGADPQMGAEIGERRFTKRMI
eukprot:4241852-Prymnesium_polylepis.1